MLGSHDGGFRAARKTIVENEASDSERFAGGIRHADDRPSDKDGEHRQRGKSDDAARAEGECGKDQEAEKVGAQTEVLRQWLKERWGGVRQAIDYLHDRQAVGILIEFFTAIGKPEAAAGHFRAAALLPQGQDAG